MTATAIGICGLVATFVLIALRTPIAFALAGCALAGIYLNFAAPGGQGPEFALAVRPTLTLASGAIYELFQSYDLSAVLLFIALGHVAFAAGVTTDIYAAARVWLARVPGGLAIASIVPPRRTPSSVSKIPSGVSTGTISALKAPLSIAAAALAWLASA